MAENTSHKYDLEFIVGNEGLPSKTKFSVCLAAGGSTSADGQAELTQAFGSAADFLTPYLVFKTEGETQAAALAAYLTQEYEAAKTRAQAGPGYMEDAAGFGLAMMSAFGNPDMVQFEISNSGPNAIIKVKIAEEHQGMIQGMVQMALATFAPALDKKSWLSLSVEAGAGVDAILAPESAVAEFTKLFKVVVKGDVSLAVSDALRSFVPLPADQKLALDGLSAMFREVVLKLRFKDFSALPQDIRDKAGCANELGMAPMLLGMVGPENKRIIKDAVQRGATSVELVVLGEHSMAKVLLQFLGVEKLF
jgi:hypothetical protein